MIKINSITIKGKTITLSFDETIVDKQTITHTIKTREEPHDDFINAFAKLKDTAVNIMDIIGKHAVPIKLSLKHEKFFFWFEITIMKGNEYGSSLMRTPRIASNSRYCEKFPSVKETINTIIEEASLFINENKRKITQQSIFEPIISKTITTEQVNGNVHITGHIEDEGMVVDGILEIPINNIMDGEPPTEDYYDDMEGEPVEDNFSEFDDIPNTVAEDTEPQHMDDIAEETDFDENTVIKNTPAVKASKVKAITNKAKVVISSKKKKKK